MEEEELREAACQTMGTGSILEEGRNGNAFLLKEDISLSRTTSILGDNRAGSLSRMNFGLREEAGDSLDGAISNSNSILLRKCRMELILGEEGTENHFLKKKIGNKEEYEQPSSSNRNWLLREEEEEEKNEIDFEKSFLLVNVTSCCLGDLPGHSGSRKRPDLKPTVRQRAFSSRRTRARRCSESGDQGPDQSLQVRERPQSSWDFFPLPFLEVKMEEVGNTSSEDEVDHHDDHNRHHQVGKVLTSNPWNLFFCVLLLLPRMAICDIPRCNPDNMGDNPFCIPLDYNKVREILKNSHSE